MRSLREFYSGRTILMTGATGFLGKALGEKILRATPDIRRLYLLVRPGRKPDGSELDGFERLRREIFETAICARLRQIHGERFWSFIEEKVVAVPGELGSEGLGLAADTLEELRGEVDTVIHTAASVQFDERIDDAVRLNTRVPPRMVELTRSLRKPSILVLVSTAYVSGERTGRVLEELAQDGSSPARLNGRLDAPGLDVERELREIEQFTAETHGRSRTDRVTRRCREEAQAALADAEPGETLEALSEQARERWLKAELVREGMRRARRLGWHDVYTFTKAMGETLAARARGDLPVAIIRPSIIESSFAEPEPGWINGLKVADPLIAAYATGRLPDFPGRRSVTLDFVPVDFVANATLAAAEPIERERGLKIYHVATGARNPVRVGEVFDLLQAYYRRHPMRDDKGEAIRAVDWSFPSVRSFRAKYRFGVQLPAGAAAWVMQQTSFLPWPAGLARKLAKTADQVDKLLYYTDLYGGYTNLDCAFDGRNAKALWQNLGAEDRAAFNFDVEAIDWKVYIQDIHLSGLDRHVLRFGSGRSTRGRRRRGIHKGLSTEDLRVIPDLFRLSSERFADKAALQTRRDGGWYRVTFSEIYERAGLMGALWRREGFVKGDRVVLISENQPEWAIAYMAAQALGLTVVPLDIHTPQPEVEEIIAFTEARALLTSRAIYPHLPKRVRSSPLPIWDINNHGFPFPERGGPQPAAPRAADVRWEELSPDDVASIIFTSGPAVSPRGVMLTHRNFLSNLLSLSEVLRSYETDRFVSVLPLNHALEFTGGLLMPIFSGSTLTYATSLKSKVLLETIAETGATALLAVPRIFELLYDRLKRIERDTQSESERSPELEYFITRIRLLVSGGAPLDATISESFATLGIPIHEGYGLTETSPILTVNPMWAIRVPSVGKPLPGVELRIDAPDANGDGEIVVRGLNVMKGYFRNQAETDAVLRDGWLHTGDIGRVDADGYVTITGRSKELIVTGAGKNVWPEEIELFYKSLPGVEELAVFGVRPPGATRESVHAAVYTRQEQEPILDAIHGMSHERPAYQRIQSVHFSDQPLPRRDGRRFDRAALREQALGELSSARSKKRRKAVAGSTDAPWWERDVLAILGRIASRPDDEPLQAREAISGLFDSLQSVELLAALEARFGITLGEEETESLHTVQDVLDRVAKVVGDRPPDERAEGLEAGFDGDYWSRAIAEAARSTAASSHAVRTSPLLAPLQTAFQAASFAALKAGFRLSVRGRANLPSDLGFLVAANHSSHLDTVAVLAALDGTVRKVHVLGARDYFFETPLKSWFFRNFLNVVPFDRDKNFVEGFRTCRQILKPEEPILIFPEGTRSTTGRLQPLKVGLGILALELGAPVVPTRIRGTFESLPKGKAVPRLQRIDVAFGEPVRMEPYIERRGSVNTYELYREVMSEVRQRLERLMEEG